MKLTKVRLMLRHALLKNCDEIDYVWYVLGHVSCHVAKF